jgi:hypothetical protein
MTETIPNYTDLDIQHLKDRLARMSSQERTSLNEQALITLLFIYSNGTPEHSEEAIERYPDLANRNPIVHERVGDYFILDLLRCNGYIEGQSNRQARWYRIVLTERGRELAVRLCQAFAGSNAHINVVALE